MTTVPPFGALVEIPAGDVLMGSDRGREDERPAHRVWVDAFAIGVYPVTRREYGEFLTDTGHPTPKEWERPELARPDLPVVGVSWHDAVAYCAWRSAAEAVLRLPTEAEWERAARGAHEAWTFPWGESIPGWVPNGGRGPLDGPWPVTLGEPNEFGLYGISANIHEWCADWYARDHYSRAESRNPVGPSEGTRRASRGGAWRHVMTVSRISARSSLDPTFRYNDYGFRVAR